MEYRCYYCERKSSIFEELIEHICAAHGEEVLKLKSAQHSSKGYVVQTKNFQIVPNEIHKQGKYIEADGETCIIKLKKYDDHVASTYCKFPCTSSTPLKTTKQLSFAGSGNISDGENDEQNLSSYFQDISLLDHEQSKDSATQTETNINDNDELYLEITQMIPGIIETLKDSNMTDMYLKFNDLLNRKALPMKNIVLLLFSDVVEWYSHENTHTMRYSPEVKQFWRIGMKLFKGKFFRFMGGWKNQGLNQKGKTGPQDSTINFAVPHHSCLEDTDLSQNLKNIEPGILREMIEIAKSDDLDQQKTFKLCIDRKKINTGAIDQREGDVNLWGYETKPTLSERQNELEKDQVLLQQFSEILESLDSRDMTDLSETLPEQREQVGIIGKKILKMFSKRVSTLRTVKQGKTAALTKLQTACITPLLKEKYTFAISAIKTYLYRLNMTISRVMNAFDVLGSIVAECSGVKHLYNRGQNCDLSVQENYICLTGPIKIPSTDDFTNTSNIKQRSDVWLAMRKKARVTGSTAQTALGFYGLKKMKEHHEYVFHSREKPTPGTEEMKRMEYGTSNEIHAIATLASKVLPVFFPSLSYVEKGCEMIHYKDMPFAVVSPDGSMRHTDEMKNPHLEKKHAVEIKCPFPGQVFKTPVCYSLPWYYVIQILFEMFVLQTDSLLFLCYSSESTSIFVAKFDNHLFQEILTMLQRMYGQECSPPKKLPGEKEELKNKLQKYCKTNVEFLAEMPSARASRQCSHKATTENMSEVGHNIHLKNQNNFDEDSSTLLRLHSLTQELRELLDDSYILQRHLASEVLVFLISDLDRMHTRERQYSIPIGYALKGYSLTSSVFRCLIDDVLFECFNRGLYVPVISYDGQWSSLAVRDKAGYPLTLLQLQKDVFKEAKKTSKHVILQTIKQSNVVDCTTKEEAAQKIICSFQTNEFGYYVGPINLEKASSCLHIFQTSSSVRRILRKTGICKRDLKESNDSLEHEAFLDEIPPSVASTLDEDILSNLRHDSGSLGKVPLTEISDMSGPLQSLFSCDNNDNSEVVMEIDCCELDPVERGIEGDDSEVCDQLVTPIFLTNALMELMINALVSDEKAKNIKWKDMSLSGFKDKILDSDSIRKSFTRSELQICIRSISSYLKTERIEFSLSDRKENLVNFLVKLATSNKEALTKRVTRRPKRKLTTLKKLCTTEINKFPKTALNIVFAEYLFPLRLKEWQEHSLFSASINISGVPGESHWYSQPEYEHRTFTYQFHLLDCHHLYVNARVKCCSTGILESGIRRDAWVKVAKNGVNNNTGLSLALVEDLVDKQSNAYAQKTFSEAVEMAMRDNGNANEANFCRLIRQWYEAEDNPGINALERIHRRLAFRKWLLHDVNFLKFPPYGSHVKGIPHIMLEGILTNIERRIQLFPFVKSGKYNVWSLGSLEVENFFGAFEDLDPKGSGIIRPTDIPNAISSACELIGTRLDPNRAFHMHTSKAKVYPVHDLANSQPHIQTGIFIMPSFVTEIFPRDHYFDSSERSERKKGKRKRGEISRPSVPSRGAKPVRQYHKCDEAKILPHVRLGIALDEMDYFDTRY